ncbi:MAG TPA: hypothetical protein VFH26_03930 [Gemmatimonadales bacterium]|nr:hypothetical protein [Gemmatimonadales bacterium]
MSRCKRACLSAVALAVAACGGSKDQNTADSNGEGSSAVRPPSGGGGTATTIHLVVGGGPHAGTYDAKSDDITCTYGFAGKGSWGNQYSVMGKKATEFSSLQLIVPDTKDAADGTDKFLMTVGFGELMQPSWSEHTINTGASLQGVSDDVKKEGTGTVKIDDRGKTGKVTFQGKTKDDVSLEGTIDCHQLMRSEG